MTRESVWELIRKYSDESPARAPTSSVAFNGRLMGVSTLQEREATVVRIPATESRHASIGMTYAEEHPFILMSEGMNDAGLACCICGIGVDDKGRTLGTAEGKGRLNASTAVRFLMDGADSVRDAVRMLSEKDVYCIGNESHLLLCDRKGSAAVEFIDDRMTVTYGANILTGFYVSGFETEADLSDHPRGLERYRVLEGGIRDVVNRDEMAGLMMRACPGGLLPSELYGDYRSQGLGDFGIRSDMRDWEGRLDALRMINGVSDTPPNASVYDLETMILATYEGSSEGEVHLMP